MTAGYYAMDLSSRRIVFICDRSLSMKAGDRWGQLATNLTDSIFGLESDYKFTAIFYGSKTEQFSTRLIPVSLSSQKRFSRFIAKLEPAGEKTLTSDGLKAALKIKNINTAYLLSDGVPYGEPLLETFREWHKYDPTGSIILHTISIDPKVQGQDDFLFLLAQLGWGDFVSVSDNQAQYHITAILDIKGKKGTSGALKDNKVQK